MRGAKRLNICARVTRAVGLLLESARFRCLSPQAFPPDEKNKSNVFSLSFVLNIERSHCIVFYSEATHCRHLCVDGGGQYCLEVSQKPVDFDEVSGWWALKRKVTFRRKCEEQIS